MFQHQGIWLPDGEKHFPEWMTKNGEVVDGRGTYQIRKWRSCLPWMKQYRTAIDVGAHVGFWSIQMAQLFFRVCAFEPMPQFRECFERNVTRKDNVILYDNPLGDRDALVRMSYDPADSGNTHVDEGVVGIHRMRTIDSFWFEEVDFLKIDCEGYEHHVIEGARRTLQAWKPCVIVEQKQHKMAKNYPGLSGTPAVALLMAMGAKLRKEISGDYILSWD